MSPLNDEHLRDRKPSSNTIEEPAMKEKTYIFWIVITFIYAVTAINSIILFVILCIVQSEENIQLESESVSFTRRADIRTVYKEDGIVRGFRDHPIEVGGDSGAGFIVSMKDHVRNVVRDKLIINRNAVNVEGVRHFNVIEPGSNRSLFQLNMKQINLSSDTSSLYVNGELRASGVISLDRSSLQVQSDKFVNVLGNGGIRLSGQNLSLLADGEIRFANENASILLKTNSLLFSQRKLPFAAPTDRDRASAGSVTTAYYKLCLCLPSGLIFTVPVSSADDASSDDFACSFADKQSLSGFPGIFR